MRDNPTPQEAAMSETRNTFIVGRKTVYVVTHAHSGGFSAGIETVGQFDSHDRALKIAQALRDATPGATVDDDGAGFDVVETATGPVKVRPGGSAAVASDRL
ncbi:hypothetical protein [Achromobacter denitrificans]|uniref:hypothetical protein n=1 Tax=Achromobacter denitrificans TaxID=32002 RepID=UPI003D04713F